MKSVDEWPFIDDRTIELLRDIYTITDGSLSLSEWDRAFLCGQRSVVDKLESIRKLQQKQL